MRSVGFPYMGLEDILPDEADKRGAKTDTDKEQEAYKTVKGPRGKEKRFNKEKWKEVRRVIDREFEDSYLEVMNNYSKKKRFDVVHQAALVSEEQKQLSRTGRETKTRCSVCGSDCADANVEIEGEKVCPQHPAAKVRVELDK